MSKIRVGEATDYLRNLRPFRAGDVLHADTFSVGSPDPVPLGGLTRIQEKQLLAARQINADHYLPYCARCRQRVTWDTTHGGFRTWLHEDESRADHIAEQVSHPDSHRMHPAGLHYVVWVGADVAAWVLNSGAVVYVEGESFPRHRAMIREALGESVAPRTSR